MKLGFKNLIKDVGVVKSILLLVLLLLLASILGINVYINSRDVSLLKNPLPQPTIIYDKNGEIASKVPGRKIEAVDFEDIPDHVVKAVVAIEDHRFYEHPGVDYIGILRALFRNIKAGEIVEGGSTITQQLAKNVFLTDEQTLDRKIEEYFLAQKIDRTFSKDKIMEMYLNHIYFGEGAWGIKNAAQTYFGKKVEDLTVSEGATLAGLIKAPSLINPIINKESAIERRNLVLRKMKQNGFLSKQDAKVAMQEELVVKGKQIDPYEGKYPYYVDHIIEEAITKYGLTQNEVMSGGLKIYTELDTHMQESVESVFKKDELFPNSPDNQLVQGGAILVNPETGGINALVGGRGEHVFRGFNRATQLERQPGSSIKPLAVYTPVLEKGYSMFDLVPDRPMDFNGYQPANYANHYEGSETIYEALTESDNVPAVWLLNKIGVEAGIQSVKRFGLPITENDHNLSLALGGLSEGVAPIDMAEAYTAFPNEGIKTTAHAITKIIDSKGNTIGEWKDQSKRVLSSEVAKRMTFLLKGVIENGTGKNARIEGRELAGKTGSTQVAIPGVDGVKDQWMVGYTPNLVGALWIGYDKTDKTHYLHTTSGSTATYIFKAIMEQALLNTPASSFDLPVYKPQNNHSNEKSKARNDEDQHGKKKEKGNKGNNGKGKEKGKKHHGKKDDE